MTYQGHVYAKNGTPLEGIRVSDGRNVAMTDKDGAFTLAGWQKTSMIFCNVLTRSHDDWYHPVKNHENSFDFYLDPVSDCNEYQFLHLSDTEIGNDGCDRFLPFIQERVKNTSVAFVMHGGDICGEAAMVRHREEMNFETVGCPVRYCIGNHDFLDGPYGEARYEELYGPVWYSFDLGKIRYLILAISKGSGGFSAGYTFEEQCRFLENDLADLKPEQKLIVFRHNDFPECVGFRAEFEEFSYDFKEKGLIAWIQGHAHTNFLIRKHGVLHMCSTRPGSGGIDNTPDSIRGVTVKGDTVSSEILYYTLPVAHEPDPALWQVRLPSEIQQCSLVDLGSAIAIATCDDGFPKKSGIFALDKATGSILWQYQTENSIKSDMAYDGSTLFAQDCEGNLYALNALSGELIWKVNSPDSEKHHSRACVVLSGDMLLAGNGVHPLFFRKTDGALLFDCGEAGKGYSAPAKTVLSPSGDTVLYHGQWSHLSAFHTKDGSLKWCLKSQKAVLGSHGAFWYRTSTPLFHKGKIYAFGYGSGAVVEPESGEILLHRRVPFHTEVTGGPMGDGNRLYFPTGKQGVVVLDDETLDLLFSYEVGGATVFSGSYVSGSQKTVEARPQLQKDLVVFPANDGKVYFCKKDSPETVKTIALVSPSLSAPLLEDEAMYTASFDGTVAKYRI